MKDAVDTDTHACQTSLDLLMVVARIILSMATRGVARSKNAGWTRMMSVLSASL